VGEQGEVRKRGGWLAGVRRAGLVTIAAVLFLAAVYGAGFYGLTRTGSAGASRGPAGKPCTADGDHSFKHGAPPCTTTTSSSSSASTPPISSSLSLSDTATFSSSSVGSTPPISSSLSDSATLSGGSLTG
jgi:hypothetical protein